jgi:hypothetical protein
MKSAQKQNVIKFDFHHRELRNQNTEEATHTEQSLLPAVAGYSHGQL